MANIKITDLTAYTNPRNTDVLPIVDVTSDTTKKVSIADLLKNASAGTAAAPGIAFDGDNTGIYSPGADQLAISTGGTGRLFVDASGNVGIGTTAPARKLVVSTGSDSPAGDITIGLGAVAPGSSRQAGITKNTTAPLELTFTASNGAVSAGTIFKNTSTNETARIDTSGRLLVNTSSDSGGALLQVNGNRVRIATAKTPASASDTGTTGEICWDADYIYVCTATNTWKRTAIATW